QEKPLHLRFIVIIATFSFILSPIYAFILESHANPWSVILAYPCTCLHYQFVWRCLIFKAFMGIMAGTFRSLAYFQKEITLALEGNWMILLLMLSGNFMDTKTIKPTACISNMEKINEIQNLFLGHFDLHRNSHLLHLLRHQIL
ncbi:hypothetical protein ACJX0J_040927, partial [Zea mays]